MGGYAVRQLVTCDPQTPRCCFFPSNCFVKRFFMQGIIYSWTPFIRELAIQIHLFLPYQKTRLYHYASNRCELASPQFSWLSADWLCTDWPLTESRHWLCATVLLRNTKVRRRPSRPKLLLVAIRQAYKVQLRQGNILEGNTGNRERHWGPDSLRWGEEENWKVMEILGLVLGFKMRGDLREKCFTVRFIAQWESSRKLSRSKFQL